MAVYSCLLKQHIGACIHLILCACNSASNSCDLNGEGVAVGDASSRCCTCTVGLNILSGRDRFTV